MISKIFHKVVILSRFQRLSIEHKLLEINRKRILPHVSISNITCLQPKLNVILQGKVQYLSPSIVNLTNCCFLQVRRNKHSKKSSSKRPEYDSDSDDSDDEFKDDVGSKVMTVKVNSLRADSILKVGLGIARNKVEAAFYEDNIRVNGLKIPKNSVKLNIGDEVDFIRNISPMNSEFLQISRIVILSANERDDDEDGLKVKLRKFKTLYIEDYEEHPWKKNKIQDTN